MTYYDEEQDVVISREQFKCFEETLEENKRLRKMEDIKYFTYEYKIKFVKGGEEDIWRKKREELEKELWELCKKHNVDLLKRLYQEKLN